MRLGDQAFKDLELQSLRVGLTRMGNVWDPRGIRDMAVGERTRAQQDHASRTRMGPDAGLNLCPVALILLKPVEDCTDVCGGSLED